VKNVPTEEGPEDRIAPERDIDIDGDYPDSLFDDRTWGSQLEGLRHRITTLSILIPLLLCAIALIGYLDLRYKISHIQSAGSKKVETLSEDMVHKIESLSYQYETLDASVAKALTGIEQSITSIKDRLKESEQGIAELATASETGKKTFLLLEEKIARNQGFLDGLEKELGGRLNEDANILTAVQNDLMGQSKEIARLAERMEAIQKEAQIQETAIRHLLEDKVDKETLARSLAEERANDEQEMSLLDERLKSLADEVSWLGKRVEVIQLGLEGREADASKVKGASDKGSEASGEASSPLDIHEQEITE
jgi:chromosome segregation ATPase